MHRASMMIPAAARLTVVVGAVVLLTLLPGTVSGMSVDQENDLEVVFHILDIDVGYSMLEESELEWAVVADLVLPINIRPVSEDVRGQGRTLGTTLDWNIASRLRRPGLTVRPPASFSAVGSGSSSVSGGTGGAGPR